jgi:hypothetical protein
MGTCICVTCGNHFPDPCPEMCAVCADELRSGGWEIVRSSALRYIEHLEGVA